MSDRVHGLPVVVLATLVVVVMAVKESLDGLKTAASTASGVAVVLVVLTLGAVVVHQAARRSPSAWPRWSLAGLAVGSSILLVIVVVSTYRAHTASTRFADQVASFPLPAGYRPVSASQGEPQHANEPQRAARAWRVPSGAEPCADIERAFTAWTDQPGQSFKRGSGCAVVTTKGTNKSEVSVSQDGRVVLLEMWLEGSSLFEF